jgi:thiol:disulfide interchange protein DsbD
MRHKAMAVMVCCYSFLLGLFPLLAPEAPVERISAHTANVALLLPTQTIRPGAKLEGLVQFYIEPGWHMYWKNPGDTGLAPSFDWQLPHGMTVQDFQWPVPSYFERAGSNFYGYEKNPRWIVTFALDETMPEGTYPITLSAFWLACDGSCVPSSQQFETSITVSATAPEIPPFPPVAAARQQLPIPVHEGTATVSDDRFVVVFPVPEEQIALLETVLLFPEAQGLFAVDHMPEWRRMGDGLELSVPALPRAKDLLLQTKRFVGLAQLRTPLSQITYALDLPYVTSTMGPVASDNDQDQWSPVDTSKEMNALHADNGMKFILLMAFVGGVLLNITPCVLPVVGMKVLTLVSFRNLRWWQTLPHGLLFTIGVLTAFWALAGGLYLFEHLGMAVGWGFQLQQPLFVAALMVLLFCLAMNLFGLFEIGTSIAAWASDIEQKAGMPAAKTNPAYSSSYVSGVLATLVATPCTGPLLGSVLGFAATFQPIDGMLLFSAIGLGVAFPFLLISLFPMLIRLLPKPGPWMVGLKQFFGFCLLATVFWLVWVLHAQKPLLTLPSVVGSFTLMSFALWIYGRWGTPVRSRICRFFGRLVSIGLFCIGVLTFIAAIDSRVATWIHEKMPRHETIQWEPFSQERVTKEVARDRIVFVKFSAKWCLTCQTNELSFLSQDVVDLFHDRKIVALQADWTDGDPSITAALRSLGRNGVPVYAVFRENKAPYILPEILTPHIVVQAVQAATAD